MSSATRRSHTYQRKTRRVSSRLVKRKQKKMTQQTVWIVVITLILLLGFIFVVLPGAVRLFFKILDSDTGLELGDTVPPQTPVLSAPPAATMSAVIPLSGYAEPESEVIFVLNGQEQAKEKVDETGEFKFDLTLTDGENVLVVYGIDEAGNESVQTKSYQIVMDREPPEIMLDELQDGQEFETKKNQRLSIRGITEANAKVYLNDRLVYAKSDGAFNTTYQLQEGDNLLKFKAQDQAGNISEMEITVKFRY